MGGWMRNQEGHLLPGDAKMWLFIVQSPPPRDFVVHMGSTAERA